MERFFNTAGPVDPEIHYLIDPLKRIDLPEVMRLIEQRKYFVLHAPRQTGKTSSLLALQRHLNAGGRYSCVYMNVEAGQAARENVASAMKALCSELVSRLRETLNCTEADRWYADAWQSAGETGALNALMGAWTRSSGKPTIAFIDEIDSLVGDTLISVLRQIRSGYDRRPANFPQSIILCGVRDVRDYRIKQDGKDIITGGSAFNIKTESLRVGDFSPQEVAALLDQHTAATAQEFMADAKERVFTLTNGQPWLVNALAYEICFRKAQGRDRAVLITAALVDAAKESLILRRDTHLDQLADKLTEPRVRRVVEPILAGLSEPRGIPSDDISYVCDLGLIRVEPNLAISNPIYQEVIPRELTSSTQQTITHQSAWYVDAKTGRLDMDKLIAAFQQFFRENASAWLEKFDYKEAGPQLLLQAFLQRVVNGGGSIAREYGLGRQRVDLCVSWPLPSGEVQKEVIELKLLRASLQSTITQGLAQTAEYMNACGVRYGHLLIFDRSTKKPWSRKIFRRRKSVDGKLVTVWGV